MKAYTVWMENWTQCVKGSPLKKKVLKKCVSLQIAKSRDGAKKPKVYKGKDFRDLSGFCSSLPSCNFIHGIENV